MGLSLLRRSWWSSRVTPEKQKSSSRGKKSRPPGSVSGRKERVNWEYLSVLLRKTPGFGLGIAISGGRDNPGPGGDISIVVSDVLKAGPAEGKLLVHDRILNANGVNFEDIPYGRAIEVLRESGTNVQLVVKRKVGTGHSVEDGLSTFKIALSRTSSSKKKKDDFGIILGCKIYIKEIRSRSLLKSKEILEGDFVSHINGANTHHLTLKDAKKLLRSTREKLNLVLQRPQRALKSSPPPLAIMQNPQEFQGLQGRHSPSRIPYFEKTKAQFSNGNIYHPEIEEKGPPRPPLPINFGGFGGFENPEEKSNVFRLPPPPARSRAPINLSEVNHLFLDENGNESRCFGNLGVIDEGNRPPSSPPPPPPKPSRKKNGFHDGSKTPESLPDPPGHLFEDVGEQHRGQDEAEVNFSMALEKRRVFPGKRLVSFVRDGGPLGIRLIGGNETGIFVGGVQPQSPPFHGGLEIADKILKLNNIDFCGVTREEATLLLLTTTDEVNLIVRHEEEEFEGLLASAAGDSFYIRSNFGQVGHGHRGELSFDTGEIFHVVDTLAGGRVGSWVALRLGKDNNEEEEGLIPNRINAEELSIALHKREVIKKEESHRRKGFGFLGGLLRKLVKKTVNESKDKLIKLPAYERVFLRHPGFIRPLVLFGPIASIARKKLLRDYPDKFTVPDSYKENKLIDLRGIREGIQRRKHSIIEIKAGDTAPILKKLREAHLHPIVILLKVESKLILKEIWKSEMRSKSLTQRILKGRTRPAWAKVQESWRTFESDFGRHLTKVVTLSSKSSWLRSLLEAISSEQNCPLWMVGEENREGNDQLGLSDLYLGVERPSIIGGNENPPPPHTPNSLNSNPMSRIANKTFYRFPSNSPPPPTSVQNYQIY